MSVDSMEMDHLSPGQSVNAHRGAKRNYSRNTLFTFQQVISILLLAFLVALEIRNVINEDARVDSLENDLKTRFQNLDGKIMILEEKITNNHIKTTKHINQSSTLASSLADSIKITLKTRTDLVYKDTRKHLDLLKEVLIDVKNAIRTVDSNVMKNNINLAQVNISLSEQVMHALKEQLEVQLKANDKVEALKEEITGLDLSITNTTSSLMSHIEEKAIAAIDQTLGSHDILTTMLGNTSEVVKKAIESGINKNNENIAMLQADVKTISDNVKMQITTIEDIQYNCLDLLEMSYNNVSRDLNDVLLSEINTQVQITANIRKTTELQNLTRKWSEKASEEFNVTKNKVYELEEENNKTLNQSVLYLEGQLNENEETVLEEMNKTRQWILRDLSDLEMSVERFSEGTNNTRLEYSKNIQNLATMMNESTINIISKINETLESGMTSDKGLSDLIQRTSNTMMQRTDELEQKANASSRETIAKVEHLLDLLKCPDSWARVAGYCTMFFNTALTFAP